MVKQMVDEKPVSPSRYLGDTKNMNEAAIVTLRSKTKQTSLDFFSLNHETIK